MHLRSRRGQIRGKRFEPPEAGLYSPLKYSSTQRNRSSQEASASSFARNSKREVLHRKCLKVMDLTRMQESWAHLFAGCGNRSCFCANETLKVPEKIRGEGLSIGRFLTNDLVAFDDCGNANTRQPILGSFLYTNYLTHRSNKHLRAPRDFGRQ